MNASPRHSHRFSIDENGELVCTPCLPPMREDLRWVHEWYISSPDDKEAIIAGLECMLAGGDEAYDFLCQRAALMVDEMLENAVFAAPRAEDGRPLYAKGEKRTLLPEERIVLRCSFDGKRLSLEVSDSWGSLSPETVRRFITLNLATEAPESDRSGRGLFFMWRFMDDFYVSVRPGEETAVGGILPLYPQIIEQGAENHGILFQD